MKPRNFENFIDGFKELTVPAGAPEEFATWAALWTVSAAVERRVKTFTRRRWTYPNIFAMLMSPPGIGKGLVIEPAMQLLDKVGNDRVGVASMTHASFIDELAKCQVSLIDTKSKKTEEYYAMHIASPDLQVMLPTYDSHMLGKFTHIWDGVKYGERRRTGGEKYNIDISRAYVTMFAGTTPVHMFDIFDQTAFEGGFLSRTMLVWSDGEGQAIDIFDDSITPEEVEALEQKLVEDLAAISKLQGTFTFDAEAKAKMRTFSTQNGNKGGNPVPSSPRLETYCTRRTHHLTKLIMLVAIAQGNTSFVLTGDHYDCAYELLIETEDKMPQIFLKTTVGGDSEKFELAVNDAKIIFAKTKKPIPKGVLMQRLVRWGFAANTIAFTLQSATQGGWFKLVKDKKTGEVGYIPEFENPSDLERKMKK